MSYQHYLFIKRLHRSQVLQTLAELNGVDGMTEELYKKYTTVGLVHCPVGEYKRLKMKMDVEGEQYDCHWDNSFRHYIFEAKRGTLL